MAKDYTIGLDIGVGSVGWAVLMEDYDLVKKKIPVQGNTEKKTIKKNLWGVRLFDSGKTAQERRLKRTTRRRIARRRNRILKLQEIFGNEMQNTDVAFFQRLDESFLTNEEKRAEKYPIFGTIAEEAAYHQKFPTIYHLRKYLADTKEKADLRLIYLALAHMIKFRGHFLIEGSLDTKNISIEETFKRFIQEYNQQFNKEGEFLDEKQAVVAAVILNEDFSRSKKAENILQLFPSEKKNGTFAQFIKLIVGNQGKFKKVFDLEEEIALQMTKEEYDASLEELLGKIGDEYSDVFVAAKNTHDAAELSGILTTKNTVTNAKLSASMVERYEEHKRDLKKFKTFIRQNLPEKYAAIFKDQTMNGYAGFIERKTKQEDFYQYLKKEINGVAGAEYFLEKMEEENFLRKQRAFDNGVIPHQIHLEELSAILKQQAVYYPFLAENQEKIKMLLTFRIPYYVGPIAKGQSEFAWLTRKTNQKIEPWNFEKSIDIAASATRFIEKMTNYDTYLPDEKVLPKHSLLYEKYMVYNELTKIKYMDDQGIIHNFSSVEKQHIFNELFKNQRKVKKSDLEKFLKLHYNIEQATVQNLESSFNASYTTYQDLKKAGITETFLDDPENEEILEDIIKILTVFEDKKMIRSQLKKYQAVFDTKTLKNLERRHYTGWGRLSAKLIHGIRDKQSRKTLLDYLIEDDRPGKNINRNFMQLINDDDLSFKQTIEEQQSSVVSESLHEVVKKIPGSPAIKKGILQSLKIVEEIVEIMGYEPKNIVVEMARENQTTETGNRNAKPRLNKLKESLQELGSDLLKEHPVDNKDLQNDRLYLYYLQNGRDMYTPEELSLDKLSSYDIDHIIPQHFTVDNSIDNRVLVSSAKNRGKSGDLLSPEIIKKMSPFWERLYASHLISKKKRDNLYKGRLSLEDKQQFIQRQLVETRQITKHVARILHQRFNTEQTDKEPSKKTQIITLKSLLTSEFRKNFQIYKLREINDYHHAHDAYLNGVIANTLLKVYPKLKPEFVYGDYRKVEFRSAEKATERKYLYSNIMKFFAEEKKIDDENGKIVWDKEKSIATIKKVLDYRQMNIVKKTEIQTGSFSNETIKAKGPSEKLIRRKNDWDPAKYGGFDTPTVAYSVVIKHEKGKQRKIVKEIVGITIMERPAFEKNNIKFLEQKGFISPIVLIRLPKYTLYELENGRKRMLASASEAQKGNQMFLPQHLVTLLYHAKKCEKSAQSLEYVEEHREDFARVLDHVRTFAERYTLVPKNLKLIMETYEKNKQAEIKEVARSFIALMQLNAMGAPADFKFFGEKIARSRYKGIKELLDGVIIHQSITGLYETRRRLAE